MAPPCATSFLPDWCWCLAVSSPVSQGRPTSTTAACWAAGTARWPCLWRMKSECRLWWAGRSTRRGLSLWRCAKSASGEEMVCNSTAASLWTFAFFLKVFGDAPIEGHAEIERPPLFPVHFFNNNLLSIIESHSASGSFEMIAVLKEFHQRRSLAGTVTRWSGCVSVNASYFKHFKNKMPLIQASHFPPWLFSLEAFGWKSISGRNAEAFTHYVI